jgi:ComF family protein
MPRIGKVSSLWNRAKLYKQTAEDWMVGATECCVCHGSGSAATGLCYGCYADLPTRAARLKRSIDGVDAAWVAFRYEFPVTEIIQAAKFHRDLSALAVLASGFTAEFAAPVGTMDMLVPVPLLPWRFMQRGFNQARELAERLSEVSGVPLREDVVTRRHFWGRAQSRLDAASRRANMTTAFKVKRDLSGLRIVIVDDVITTGATCAALARVLRAAGAAQVFVVAAAATPRHHD